MNGGLLFDINTINSGGKEQAVMQHVPAAARDRKRQACVHPPAASTVGPYRERKQACMLAPATAT